MLRDEAIQFPDGANARVSDEDWALVQAVCNGNSSAFNDLARKYRSRIFSVIYNITGNREDAADLTQEALIQAFKSVASFRGHSSLYTWFYRIAVNRALAHLRRNRLRHFFSFEKINEEAVSSDFLDALVSRLKTDKPLLLKELQEKLNDSLQSLSPKHRTVIVLYEVEGLSHGEIAEVMKCSEGTVRSRLHYAREALKKSLKDFIEE